jgi:NADH-ubiquinone oxidoreductase chain 6
MKTFTHFLFSFGILFSSLSVISLGNYPVLAVVFLIATFVLSAIYLILMGINFIGITYIILYVGAIAVLFLFVIMMLNLKDKDLIEPSSFTLNNGTYSLIIVFFFAFIIGTLTTLYININNLNPLFNFYLLNYNIFFKNLNNYSNNKFDQSFLNLTQIDILGQDLYTYGAVLLISLSIILLLAMFATIIISKPNATDPSKPSQK